MTTKHQNTKRVRLGELTQFPHHFLYVTIHRAASAKAETNKENVQSSGGNSRGTVLVELSGQRSLAERTSRAKKWRHSPALVLLSDDQDTRTVSHLSQQSLWCVSDIVINDVTQVDIAQYETCTPF